jgi:hypothetical protein
MAITYELTKQRQESWGIDVTVLFTSDNGKTATKIFRFDDQAQINSEFTTRMSAAITNFENRRQRDITTKEIVKKLLNYFKTNDTLTRAQALAFIEEKIDVDGAL